VADAVAYTYTEADYDDPEMMASRTAATVLMDFVVRNAPTAFLGLRTPFCEDWFLH
jgi:hypothetical protein